MKYKIKLDKGTPTNTDQGYDYNCEMCGKSFPGTKNCQAVIDIDEDKNIPEDEREFHYVCNMRCANMYILSKI